MPGAPRPVADGLLYHALNRGNNRADIFFSAKDYLAFLDALGQTQERYPFRLYGYCLMSNHFHLLLAPEPGQSVSRILQSLTVAHTWHYHKAHGTVGHVWQGRFRSPVVQDDAHAVVVLRYIEANPLRAGMVSDLASYPWSSYRVHGMGRRDPLVSPLPAWEALARDEARRRAHWQTFVHTPFTERDEKHGGQEPFSHASRLSASLNSSGCLAARRRRGRPGGRRVLWWVAQTANGGPVGLFANPRPPRTARRRAYTACRA